MIRLIKSYPYDNNYDYVKLHSNKTEQNNYFNSFGSILIDEGIEEGYIREGNAFIVDYNYDYLVNEGVNYVIWNNGYKNLYCFITSKEYVDEECTRLYYEIDVLNTYLFDISLANSFIERKKCSINEIVDFDEGIDTGEPVLVNEIECFKKEYDTFAMFNGFTDYMVNKDKTVFTTVPLIDESKPITRIDDTVYPLLFIALNDNTSIQNFNKYLSNQPNLVGIIKMPKSDYSTTTIKLPLVEMVDGNIEKKLITCPQVVTSITRSDKISTSINVPKDSITDFFPYTYYVLTDGETDPLIMKPQYLDSGFSIRGRMALGYSPIERYFPTKYKGSTLGTVYNITNTSVMMLPIASNGGLETLVGNVNTMEQQKKSMYGNILGAVVATGVGIATGGVGLAVGAAMGLSSGVSAINAISQNIARNKDIELSPNSIKSVGTTQTRESFFTGNVRVLKYTIEDKYKNRLLNYVNRFGNKFNNYDTIDLKSYKGYIKFVAPNLDTKIDNIFTNKIISILERGVYIE